MPIHALGARQHFIESLRADGDHQCQTHRRPQGIAAANPVPDWKDAVLIDAEFDGAFGFTRHRREMVLQHHILAQIGAQPGTRGIGVEQRLLRRKCFTDDNEQRRARIEGL